MRMAREYIVARRRTWARTGSPLLGVWSGAGPGGGVFEYPAGAPRAALRPEQRQRHVDVRDANQAGRRIRCV